MSYRPLLLFSNVKYGYFTQKAEIILFAYWITKQLDLILPIFITFKKPLFSNTSIYFSLNDKLLCVFFSCVPEQNQQLYFLNQYSVCYLNENAKK